MKILSLDHGTSLMILLWKNQKKINIPEVKIYKKYFGKKVNEKFNKCKIAQLWQEVCL